MLIGTSNIATSEYLSKLLEKDGVTHYVLNAKFHEQEASIVWWGGKYKSVVVATNMAWRGTDIKLEDWLNTKLSDNYAKRIKKNIWNWNIEFNAYSNFEYEITMDAISKLFKFNENKILEAEKWRAETKDFKFTVKFNQKRKDNTDMLAKIVFKNTNWVAMPTIEKDLQYWLYVLGTEKHESRRIDNQLRWRAGRQWDAGKSVFYVALDDLIMRKMWWEKIMWMAWMLMKKDDLENLELTQKQFTSSIEKAQKQIEAWHFGIRKHLFDYDSVVDKQRQRIYTKRDQIIESELDEKLKKEFVLETRENLIRNITMLVSVKISEAKNLKQTNVEFLDAFIKEFSIKLDKKTADRRETLAFNDLEWELITTLINHLENWFKKVDDERLYQIFKDVLLHHIDTLWVQHIDEMQYLRDKVWFMWYAQQDPLVVYKKESFEKFQSLIYSYKHDTTAYMLNVDFDGIKQQEEAAKLTIERQKKWDKDLLNKLSQISWNIDSMIKSNNTDNNKKREMIFEDEDWFEVFEINENENNNQWSNTIAVTSNTKIRPNDKVTVKYTDGKMEYNIKYKKIKADVEDWKCKILSINLD